MRVIHDAQRLAPLLGLTEGLAQLLLAMKLSRLSLDLRFVVPLLFKLGGSVLVGMLPLIIVGAVVRLESGAMLAVEIVLFVVGCVIYQRLLRMTNVFDERERETLAVILEAGGLRRLNQLL